MVTDKDLTLRGVGSSVTILDRGSVSVSPAPPAVELSCTGSARITIVQLTITGGSPFQGFGGGGLENRGCQVHVNDVVFTKNGSRGVGGIFNAGTMTVQNSTIINNGVGLGGGGITNSGTLTLVDSYIGNNTTITPGEGGGLWNVGVLKLTRSLVMANTSGNQGGGIWNKAVGTLTLNGCRHQDSGQPAEQLRRRWLCVSLDRQQRLCGERRAGSGFA